MRTRSTGRDGDGALPGPTATAFQKRAGLEGTQLFRGGVMDAAAVARHGYEGMIRGARRHPWWRNRLLAQSVRFAPRRMVIQAVRSLQERRMA